MDYPLAATVLSLHLHSLIQAKGIGALNGAFPLCATFFSILAQGVLKSPQPRDESRGATLNRKEHNHDHQKQ
jgi:hypothetical protein